MSDLAQVNRILDRTCKRAGLDPIEVRLAMIQTLQAKLQNGKGLDRLPPERQETWTKAACRVGKTMGDAVTIDGKPAKPAGGATFS